MADATDAFSTIDDFLLSLAEGVSYAQGELARAGVSGPPGAQVLYQLPRVEFELKMNLTVVQDQGLSQRYRVRSVHGFRTARRPASKLAARCMAMAAHEPSTDGTTLGTAR